MLSICLFCWIVSQFQTIFIGDDGDVDDGDDEDDEDDDEVGSGGVSRSRESNFDSRRELGLMEPRGSLQGPDSSFLTTDTHLNHGVV